MPLTQIGQQVIFKRSEGEPLEPAWVAVSHDDIHVDIWTLSGRLNRVSYGGGYGQWRIPGKWVQENGDSYEYETHLKPDSEPESEPETNEGVNW